MATKRDQAVVDLVIDGRRAETSIKAVQKATYDTERMLRNMSEAADPAAYEKLKKELHQLETALSSMNSELKSQSTQLGKNQSDWQRFASNAKSTIAGVVGGNLLTQGLSKLMDLASQAPQKIAEIADEMTNVGKTTGLANDEVQALFDEFQNMDTRSTRTELAELAEIAGKLGESTLEGTTEFVKGADIIKVALAKDLGGSAEEAITKISKIIEIFNLKEQFGIQDSFLKVGSAINSLGAASSASEEYIVNFTTRLAGVAPTAKISVPDVLGLAAAMDQLGQSPELASTNIAKMILALGKNVPYFAKVAGMSIKEFSSLLKNDANEAFLRVIEGANVSGKGIEGLATTFKTLGIEGSEGAQVIGALAGKIDLVRESQRVSNEEFQSGTSVLDEYNRANTNSAAIMDKISKKFEDLWLVAKSALDPFIFSFGKLLGVINEASIATSDYNQKTQSLAKTEKNLEPLIKKYDELKSQMYAGKDVQKELNEVIQKIAKIVPEAAVKFDEYGNAIDISTKKTEEFIKSQRAAMEVLRIQTKDKVTSELQDLQKQRAVLIKELNEKQVVEASTGTGGGAVYTKQLSNSELAQRKAQVEELNKKIKEQEQSLKKLDGVLTIADRRNARRAAESSGDGGGGGGGDTKTYTGDGPNKKDKEVDEFKQLKAELQKLREDAQLDLLNSNEREVQVVKFKYERLRELAKGNKDYLTQLAELETAELGRLQEQQTTKAATEAEKQRKKAEEEYQKRQQKLDEDLGSKKKDALSEITDYTAKNQEDDQTRELTLANNEYVRLLTLATEARLAQEQILPLWDAYEAKRLAIIKKYDLKSQEVSDQRRQKEIEQVGVLTSTVGNIFASFFEIAASNETEFAEFKKIATLVQIATDTAAAISTMTAKGAYASLTPIDAAIKIATGVATVLANIAKAKAVLSDAKTPNAPNFQRMPGRATGGPTDLLSLYLDNSGNPEGYVRRPTLFNLGRRSYMAGEAGKNGVGGMEYVISNPMLQSPIHANFVALTEALRTSGYDFTKRADLGSSASTTPDAGSAQLASMMALFLAEQKATREEMAKFAKKPWNYRQIEQTQEMLDYIKTAHSA
ncbi:phage tail tape measure protein [Runella zeae]|uniref:phage tail tape measure protein n=1 Tax=Runella zeae TaxID=94255 RepID=UPI0003F89730|nr:phage tail tape measure protein [Runella zeae]